MDVSRCARTADIGEIETARGSRVRSRDAGRDAARKI